MGLRPWLVVVLLVVTACGKKGPPLAPIVRIPAAIDALDAHRAGPDVYLTFVVPAVNIDRTAEVDIGRVEVYAYTGHAAPPRSRWLEAGTLIATVPVAVVPAEGRAALLPSPGVTGAAVPGARVTVRDLLAGPALVEGRVITEGQAQRGNRAPVPVPLASAERMPLRRFYMAIAFSGRGRPGPPGRVFELPFDPPPDAPASVAVDYTADEVTLTWERSGGILGFLLERPLGLEPRPGADDFDAPAPDEAGGHAGPVGPLQYNVYRMLAPDPAQPAPAPRPAWSVLRPQPLNPSPLETTAFTDAVEFGRERCYVVRTVGGVPPAVVESAPSPVACVTPVDRFAPAPPARLVAVPAEGAISLIWEPNTEPDLAGYVVLRGAPGDATLLPLTSQPVTEARYTDRTVVSGTRYTYAVRAVDAATPDANVSRESDRAEETAR